MFRFYARGKTAKFFTLFLAGLAAGGADVIYWMQHTAAARYVPHQHHRRRGRARPARSLAESTRPRGKCVGISRKSCRGEPADACGSLNLPGRIWNPPLRCRGRCLHRPGGLTAAARLLRANHVRPYNASSWQSEAPRPRLSLPAHNPNPPRRPAHVLTHSGKPTPGRAPFTGWCGDDPCINMKKMKRQAHDFRARRFGLFMLLSPGAFSGSWAAPPPRQSPQRSPPPHRPPKVPVRTPTPSHRL